MTAWVPPDALGRRVSCGTDYGTVRYMGSVARTSGIWLGVEWDDPQRGKHDGCYEGTQYFKCRDRTHSCKDNEEGDANRSGDLRGQKWAKEWFMNILVNLF
ncbi:tubulin-specific chaperone E-like [Pipra filicauda]|uniref:Tubulin-specific chaperone E-like n=1 Tax=Pipra filicauda TaxID=649802 RepID=A0A7R5K2R6_9PASS|nr:tubulin-specific chaperone E-like [Pipra filicauda]